MGMHVFYGVGAAVVVALGVLVAVVSPDSLRWTGVLMAVVGVVPGVRLVRSDPVFFRGRVLVRGALSSRTISRSAVTGIRDAGCIEWTDDEGVPRETVVSAFMPTNGRTWGSGRAQIQEGPMTALHRWSGAGPDTTDLGMGYHPASPPRR